MVSIEIFFLGFKKEERDNHKQKYSRRWEGAFELSIRNDSSLIFKSEIQLPRISHHDIFELVNSTFLVNQSGNQQNYVP